MRVQAQVSIYPLKTKSLTEPIEAFCDALRGYDLKVETQSMNTLISGESDAVFSAIARSFEMLADQYRIVMDLKISNACPDIDGMRH